MSRLFPFVYSAFVAASIAAANDVDFSKLNPFKDSSKKPAVASEEPRKESTIAPVTSWYGKNVYGIKKGDKMYFALKSEPEDDELSVNYVFTKQEEQAKTLLTTLSEMEDWKKTTLVKWRENNPGKEYPQEISRWLKSTQELTDRRREGLMGLKAILLATDNHGTPNAHISDSEIEYAIEPWIEFKRKYTSKFY